MRQPRGLFGWRIVRVNGGSMSPRLPPDSYALFRPARRVHAGDIVLADHVRYGWIIKQVRELVDDGVTLEGIAPESTASDRLGVVHWDRLMGKLVWHVAPGHRA